jgi:hypothetical protein
MLPSLENGLRSVSIAELIADGDFKGADTDVPADWDDSGLVPRLR